MSELDRRRFLAGLTRSLGWGLAAPYLVSVGGCGDPGASELTFDLRTDSERVFDLSVASGDPSATGVVLWTHIRPSEYAPATPLRFQVASEATFANTLRTTANGGGKGRANPHQNTAPPAPLIAPQQPARRQLPDADQQERPQQGDHGVLAEALEVATPEGPEAHDPGQVAPGQQIPDRGQTGQPEAGAAQPQQRRRHPDEHRRVQRAFFGKGSAAIGLLAAGSVRCLFVERLAVTHAAPDERGPLGNHRLRVRPLRKQAPQTGVVPAQLVLGAVAMFADARAQLLDLADQLLTSHLLDIFVHAGPPFRVPIYHLLAGSQV